MNKSNNDIMWDCLEGIFDNRWNVHTELKVLKYLKSYRVHKGKEVEYNFSNDNMQVVLCWVYKFLPEYRYRVPLIGHHSLHPVRFFRFLFMKYPALFTLLLPVKLFVILEMIASATIFTRKTGEGELHTSGILLDYYLCYAYGMTWTLKVLTWIVEKRSWLSWPKVFFTYHGDASHYNYKVYVAFMRMIDRRENTI